jgi:hypothetical protein
MRWVGIDEAGYGPNLGPLVMTAVIAEGPDDRPPDVWGDLPATVSRAGGPSDGLWVDDSKKIYRAGQGLDRLETASLAALAATGRAVPETLAELLDVLEAGSTEDVELTTWLDGQEDPVVPRAETRTMLDQAIRRRPFDGAPWRIVAVRTVVFGPARFNSEMGSSRSKARAHFSAFTHLLCGVWEDTTEGVTTHVRVDKHGGRHFYLEPLYRAIPDAWIDRGDEGPDASHYTVRENGRRLEICLRPRADSDDGLVALASMMSKTVREFWMGVFNAYWTARIAELRPTAGYPRDSTRFRQAIEPHCRARGLQTESWWRSK